MNDALRSEVARWLRYAQEDLKEAQRLVGLSGTVPRHPAWLAQQAGEKALKAVLVYEQIPFPRTHDMNRLFKLIPDRWAGNADTRLAGFISYSDFTSDAAESRLRKLGSK